jgi:hypothetical protein
MFEDEGDVDPEISDETQLELDEVAVRRAGARRAPVLVIGFVGATSARVFDVTAGGELVDAGSFPITPTPPAA